MFNFLEVLNVTDFFSTCIEICLGNDNTQKFFSLRLINFWQLMLISAQILFYTVKPVCNDT